MRRRDLLAAGAAIVAGGALTTTHARRAHAAVGDPGRADVVVAKAADGKRAFFADIVRLRSGRLLAVYREGVAHTGQDGRIMLTESADLGLTWSTPRMVVDSPLDDRDPKIFQASDGTVLLSFFETDWTATVKLPVGTFVSRSTDDGATWSEPVHAGTNLQYPGGKPQSAASHGPVVEVTGGELLLPLYGVLPGGKGNSATVVRSTDGGRSWSKDTESVIAENGVDDTTAIGFYEPVLAVLPGADRVVAFVRSNEARVGYLAHSSDAGRTWTPAKRTKIPASSHHLLRIGGDSLLLTYGDISRTRSAGRPTAARIIPNAWLDWDHQSGVSADILLYDASVNGPRPTDDQANPSSVVVGAGRYLTLTSDPYTQQIVGVYSERDDYIGTR